MLPEYLLGFGCSFYEINDSQDSPDFCYIGRRLKTQDLVNSSLGWCVPCWFHLKSQNLKSLQAEHVFLKVGIHPGHFKSCKDVIEDVQVGVKILSVCVENVVNVWIPSFCVDHGGK